MRNNVINCHSCYNSALMFQLCTCVTWKMLLFSTNDMHIIFPSMLLTYEVHFETKSPKYFGFTVCTGASMDMASARNVKTKHFWLLVSNYVLCKENILFWVTLQELLHLITIWPLWISCESPNSYLFNKISIFGCRSRPF